MIPADGRPVVGLTFISNQLFVLRYPSKEEIQVYETATFTQQRTVRVAGLSDDGWCWYKALTSCDVNNCLYVSDYENVYKVDLSTDNVIKWPVDGSPMGLSVNTASNVIVTCNDGNEIREYTTSGSLVRTIKLQESLVTLPSHAVQLTDSQFVVSHHGPVYGVSLIDERGQVKATYRNSESTKLLNDPRGILVCKNGSILVADSDNNRILMINSSLSCARDLPLPLNAGLKQPWCLYLDKSCDRLYVGEYSGKRVLVFDYVRPQLQ